MMFPTFDEGRVIIVAGRFGSGKTEIALNCAVRLAKSNREIRPILIDLDIVTPYFRSRETIVEMESRGVEVVAPLPLTQCLDVPGITPEILGAIEQTSRPVVLDVGGDRQGARALGRYSASLQHRGYEMLFVVNPYRPSTLTPEAILASVQEIETSSRLCVSSLVSNPNLMNESGPDVIRDGHAVVESAANLTGLPIRFFVVSEALLDFFRTDSFPELPILPIERYFLSPWEQAGTVSSSEGN